MYGDGQESTLWKHVLARLPFGFLVPRSDRPVLAARLTTPVNLYITISSVACRSLRLPVDTAVVLGVALFIMIFENTTR